MPGSRNQPKKSSKRTKVRAVNNENVQKVSEQDFAGNTFSGEIKSDPAGARSFDSKHGKYSWPNQASYEGPLVDSRIEGSGKYTWPDGSTFSGQLKNGQRHGHGVFVAADGLTEYEGQWKQGKRHGHGKLTYRSSGIAYYDGQWQEGCKHGHGIQVWPSGNRYEGEWRCGWIAGEGKMVWSNGGVVERYEGHWENDKRDGRGSHTWEASAPPRLVTDTVSRDMPSQQLNNNYVGDFRNGLRHGRGVFSYANGATYDGDWLKGIKEGQGRYTYEDGKIHDGGFTNDAFGGGEGVPGSENLGPERVLNIGAEDNPVRRCVDVSDLLPFCLPVDVGHLEVGSGYDEDHEIMREVYNMLLRYLGEVKQLYSIYRLALKKDGEDPFLLKSRQLWIFLRDLDISSPCCSLARLNRSIFTGPRHHAETAHDDLADLQPLTPRAPNPGLVVSEAPDVANKDGTDEEPVMQKSSTNRIRTISRAFQSASNLLRLSQERLGDSPLSSRPSSIRSSFHAGEIGSGVNTLDAMPPLTATSSTKDAGAADQDLGSRPDSKLEGMAPLETERRRSASEFAPLDSIVIAKAAGPLSVLTSKFWHSPSAKAAEGRIADIHAPSKSLMLRHFLESCVRMSIARFSYEKGLEQQVRRLFREKLLPGLPTAPQKAFEEEHILAAFTDTKVLQVLDSHEEFLFRVFLEQQPYESSATPEVVEKAVAAAGDPDDSCSKTSSKRSSGQGPETADAGEELGEEAVLLGIGQCHDKSASNHAPPWCQAGAQFAPGLVFDPPPRRLSVIQAEAAAKAAAEAAAAEAAAAEAGEADAGTSLVPPPQKGTAPGPTPGASPSPAAQANASKDPATAAAAAAASAEEHGGAAGEEQEEPKPQKVRPLRHALLSGRTKRGWASGCQRRAQVCARIDSTLRVKDVFRLLDDTGILTPLSEGWERSASSSSSPQPPTQSSEEPSAEGEGEGGVEAAEAISSRNWMELSGCVLPDCIPMDRPESSDDAGATATAAAALQRQYSRSTNVTTVGQRRSMLGRSTAAYHSPASPSEDVPSNGNDGYNMESTSTGQRDSTRSTPMTHSYTVPTERAASPPVQRAFTEDLAEVRKDKDEGKQPLAKSPILEDPYNLEAQIAAYDFRVTFLEVLEILTEVLSPKSLSKLRWTTKYNVDPKHELTALLDYLEEEVTFAEFQRLLVRIVQLATEEQASHFPLFQRLGTFLDKVFVPALTTPYAPPLKDTEPEGPSTHVQHPDAIATEPAKPSQGEAPPALGDEGGRGADAAGGGEGEGGAQRKNKKKEEEDGGLPGFWRGFSNNKDLLSIKSLPAEAQIHRWWPQNYFQEVADW